MAMLEQLAFLRPGFQWLAGPILDKELRVASRRRRLYVLRFAYVCVLAAVVARLWFSVLQLGGSSVVVQISRLGEMGKQIVATVVWFQFITGQVLAAVLLSDAIGSEVRQRTLDVLLVTPIRSLQIVIGKLLSKLLQLVSLLAISLPMLAVVRVFGGVPWDYVVAGLCITLSAGIFAGSLSLMASITSRDSYHAALVVALWYLVVWGILPMVVVPLSWPGHALGRTVASILHLTHPFAVMGDLTKKMVSGSSGTGISSLWLWHCLILLVLATILLTWSVWRVRRVARRAAPVRVPEPSEEATTHPKRSWRPGAIRPVVGSPLVWKERCTPLFRTRRRGLLFGGLLFVVLAAAATLFILEKDSIFPMAAILIQIVQLIFLVDVAVAAAGAVTKEREARTWPILLTTPLEAGEIVKGKAIGVFRRNLPLLLPLPVLYLLLFLFGPSEQQPVWQLAVGSTALVCSLAGATLFLLGTGLYFSTRLKTTTAAVLATFTAYVAPKFLFCGLLSPLFLVTAGVLRAAGVPGGNPVPLAGLMIAVAPAGVYVGVGLLFMRLAVRRVRRDIF